MKKLLQHIIFIPRLPFLLLIKIYQKTLSFDHSWLKFLFPNGYCRFHPSCSQYGFEIIKKRGLIIGLPKTLWRITRCNPWNKGGVVLP
jgi:uncharacterized protein